MRKFFGCLFLLAVMNSAFCQCLVGDCENGYSEFKNNNYLYKGNFLNSKKHGNGELTNLESQTIYKGEFFNDLMHGTGECYFGEIEHYKGEFKEGKIDGKGKYIFEDGSYYEGDFLKGKLSGSGTFIFVKNGKPSGEKYEGEILNNKMHGKGKYYYSSGDIYEGEFFENKINGKGKLTYDKGNLTQIEYVGEFRENKINGQGVLKWIDDTRFEGFFENELPVKGKFFWQGELFYEGKLNYFYSEILEYMLTYKTGQFTVLTMRLFDVGFICFPNGNFYVGEVEIDKGKELDFLPSGKGIMVYSNGNYIEGYFNFSTEPYEIIKQKKFATSNGNLNMTYGIALSKYKLWSDAEKEFRKALNIDPKNDKFRKALEESIKQIEKNFF